MNADACSGFSVMAYLYLDVAYGQREAYLSTLVRIEGLYQKGNVGFSPCRAQATRTAIPPTYPLGPLDGLKRTGIRFWVELGPWAPRRLAAMEFPLRFIDCYPLPTGWDWAAVALEFKAPDPFTRGVPGSEPVVSPTIAQTKARNMVLPSPDTNKEAPKAIQDRATQDVRPEVRQAWNEGMEGLDTKDVFMGKKGKCADFQSLGGKASPTKSPLSPLMEGPLQSTMLVSKGDSCRKAHPYGKLDTAAPSGASSMGWRLQ